MRGMVISLLVLTMVLAACGGDEEEGATTQPSPTTGPIPVTPPNETTEPSETTSGDLDDLDEEARQIVESAMTDLADRTGAGLDAIRLVSFDYVTWRDGSLGCPQPGEMYTQALVDGSRTVLEVDGATYDYHAGADEEPFLCENPGSGTVPSRKE